MKKFNQVSQKLSAAVAVGVFAASAFMLSACGGGDGEDRSESAQRDMVKRYYNTRLLSFEESKKEVGLKIFDCFEDFRSKESHSRYRFTKDESGNIKVIVMNFVNGTMAPSERSISVDELKAQKPECF